MNFKIWLEGIANEASLSWDSDNQIWYKSSIGHTPTIGVYITDKSISIDYAGPNHPLMKRALKLLLKQRPDVVDKNLNFDGFIPGTIEQFLKDSTFHGPKDQLPEYLYTGTSLHHWESIREDGLRPRGDTNVDPAYGPMKPSNPDYVYLSGSFNNVVKFAARSANQDTIPVVLKISSKGLNYRLLRPDEDSNQGSWEGSLQTLNTVAYEGNISPKYITLFKVLNSQNGWVDPSPELTEPQDWLAQQMLHRKDYKSIPDSTASYKWTDPRS